MPPPVKKLWWPLAKIWGIPVAGVAPGTAGVHLLVPSGLSNYPITHKKHLCVLPELSKLARNDAASSGITWPFSERYVVFKR